MGERVLAVTSETQASMKLYTELLQKAHEGHGGEIEYRELVYGSIRGMLRTLDPHTNFLSPEAYSDMRQRQQGSFFGLGILVSMRNGQLTVISPIEGTPAWRLGLRAGDVINAIEGEPTDGMTLDEAVGKLKGPKGTDVNITIVRRGLEEPLGLAVTRAEIPQTTVRYAYMMDEGTGYVRLTDFSRSTYREVADAIATLEEQGLERLVLDLRNNGGGLLDQTVSVSNLFVPEKSRIVETRGRVTESRQVYRSDDGTEPLNIPLVVLVNDGTASAAEILAGAIQDHDIGLVVGTPTWGKGLVQTVYNLSYGAGIALTTAKYFTPSGRLIQRDYSSFFDYYTHFGQDESEEGSEVSVDSPEFSTDLGRKVYGGGGITPDEIVELEPGSMVLQMFYAKNVFFDFAVDYHQSHPGLSEDWNPGESLLDELRSWLDKDGRIIPKQVDALFADDKAKEVAQRQIHSDLFTSAFGTEAAHKVLAAGDRQIQAALDLLEDAEELLEQRQKGTQRLPDRFAASDPERLDNEGPVVNQP